MKRWVCSIVAQIETLPSYLWSLADQNLGADSLVPLPSTKGAQPAAGRATQAHVLRKCPHRWPPSSFPCVSPQSLELEGHQRGRPSEYTLCPYTLCSWGVRLRKGPCSDIASLGQLGSPHHPRAGGSESGFLTWVPPPFLFPPCLGERPLGEKGILRTPLQPTHRIPDTVVHQLLCANLPHREQGQRVSPILAGISC